MHFDQPLFDASFVARPNRYLVIAKLGGKEVTAHCADPGRLTELLQPGATIYLSRAIGNNTRKTEWDLRLVRDPETGTLVSLDTRVPNRLFEEGVRAGFFPYFREWESIARERSLPAAPTAAPSMATRRTQPHSRIDFLLTYPDKPRLWVEVKSASLVVDREARFPDAVTARGRRHLLELADLVQRGERAAVTFIVQRSDVDHIVAHRQTDPDFADALDAARAAGVGFHAATCSVTRTGVALDRLIEVR